MSNEPSIGQMSQIMNLIAQKKKTREEVNLLFTSGIFSDLLDCNLKKVDREKFRKLLGCLDFSIEVDRSTNLEFPIIIEKVLDPKLQNTGPKKYNLAEIEMWFHDGHKSKYSKGQPIYDYLKETESVSTCLGYRDGLAIVKSITSLKGEGAMKAPFWHLFGQNRLYLWRSVVEAPAGLAVPYIYSSGGSPSLVINWAWLRDHCCGPNTPALRFKD